MFIVRGMNETGTVSLSRRTSEQARQAVVELLERGFRNVTVDDANARSWTSAEFLRVDHDDDRR